MLVLKSNRDFRKTSEMERAAHSYDWTTFPGGTDDWKVAAHCCWGCLCPIRVGVGSRPSLVHLGIQSEPDTDNPGNSNRSFMDESTRGSEDHREGFRRADGLDSAWR